MRSTLDRPPQDPGYMEDARQALYRMQKSNYIQIDSETIHNPPRLQHTFLDATLPHCNIMGKPLNQRTLRLWESKMTGKPIMNKHTQDLIRWCNLYNNRVCIVNGNPGSGMTMGTIHCAGSRQQLPKDPRGRFEQPFVTIVVPTVDVVPSNSRGPVTARPPYVAPTAGATY